MFESPDGLRKYSLALAAQMRVEGYSEQSKILESRARLACTTGWEWLGELKLAVDAIRAMGSQTKDIEEKLGKIYETSTSPNPYGTL